MTVSQQMRWWGAALAVLVLLLWLLSEALFPFVLGAAIAYLTDPLADWLERHGFTRLWATVVITVVSLGLVALGILLVVPLLIEQMRDLVVVVPAWIEQARVLLRDWLPELRAEGTVLNRAVADLGNGVQAWGLGLLQRAWAGGLAVLGFLGVLLVTPVVAFYLLMDWDHLVRAIDDYLPRQHRDTIRAIARDLDRVLAGFVRGQMTVCLILGTFYAVALMLVGLKFGLLIGLFAGLISFIPFVGSIVGGALSIGVALAQFWGEPGWIVAVGATFVAGQAIEGNYLTPKLVGDKVGLHPVWLMFALSAFGVVFGFVGLLVAVPAAAAIGVVGRFLLEQYRAGPLYDAGAARGSAAPRPPARGARAMSRSRQGAFDLNYRPDLAAEEFLVSDCNRNAWNAITGWERWHEKRLALTGPAESGKTHLASIWARATGAARPHAAELTEARMQRLIESPALLIENVDRVAQLPEPMRLPIERMLFHLVNAAGAHGRPLLVTGREGPGRWQIETPDLASRLSAMPHVAIAPPDDAILSLVMQKLFRDRQQEVGQDVIAYVVLRMERSFAASRELAAALDRKALAERRRITRPLAAELLAEREAGGGPVQEKDRDE